MKPHLYIRAYLAGIAVPTVFVLFIFGSFCVARFVYNVNLPVERIVVFPLALVPTLWGLWNILYAALRPHHRLPLGLHGMLLPLLLLPLAAAIAMKLHLGLPGYFPRVFALALPVVLVAYYLVWKYVVGFLNELVRPEAR